MDVKYVKIHRKRIVKSFEIAAYYTLRSVSYTHLDVYKRQGVITLYILGEVKILYWMNWIYVDTKNEMETNYEENF